MILTRLGTMALSAPRGIISVTLLILLAAGIFGAPVATELPAGGYNNPRSESMRAHEILTNQLHAGGIPIVFEITDPHGVDTPAARRRAQTVVEALQNSPFAEQIRPFWSQSTLTNTSLISGDQRTGLIVARIAGSDSDAPQRAQDIASPVVGRHGDVTVRGGGEALAYYEVTRQLRKDLVKIEGIALPICFIIMVWTFGSAVAAALPIAVAVLAIAVTTAALRALSMFTSVSIFALNITSALCIALAIDYTLIIINRYQEELAKGEGASQAMLHTMNTAGRTVTYSAVTVALPLAAMTIFPMYFLRSLAYVGLFGVALCLLGALVVAPALLIILGDRIKKWDIRTPAYRLVGREAPAPKAPEEMFFYKSATFAMRHAVPVALLVTTFLIVLGSPFLAVKIANPDDRMLPATHQSRQVGDTLRESFPQYGNAIQIVLQSGESSEPVGDYALQLSRVDGVVSVAAPNGTYINGARVSTDNYGAAHGNGVDYLTVSSSVNPFSTAGKDQLGELKSIQAPAPNLFGGTAQQNIDGIDTIVGKIPLVFILITAATLLLIFLLTGSILLPVKTVFMNLMSLTIAFGAMVWIFQEGHFGGLGTTSTGNLNVQFLPFVFCLAFGLSMDYEVFVLSRIREEWLNTEGAADANQRAVALGLARAGRIVTAAASIMTVVFVASTVSQVQAQRMVGVGLAITIILDAFLIRTILVPAFMHLLGRANWWAPAPLRRLHGRWGFTEEPRRSGP